MQTKHLIVISFDGVSTEDLEVLSELPNFAKLIKGGALIKNVEIIYLSLTYPAHATIVTGCYPAKHGIINNTLLEIGEESPNWYWYSKDIKKDTIFDLAEKTGLKTCSILWPVTGRSKITYNMPEICCTKPWHNQIIMSALAGKISYQLPLNKKYGSLIKGIEQPYLDNFSMEAAKDTILNKKPNLMLLHLVDVDSQRHYTGYKSNEVSAALKRHDKRLGEIIDTLEKTGILKQSTIVALGDHSQIDTDKMVRLNSLFREKGLITIDNKNKIRDYKAIAKNCDGSSYIYLKNKYNEEDKRLVEKILDEIVSLDNNPIEFILNSKEAENLGADPKCTFMVEGKRSYSFIDEVTGDFIEKIKEEDIGKLPHRVKATHGYFPKRDNYTTFFIAYGNGIKKGTTIESGNLINHGPTLAKILGLELKDIDGKVEERIFNN
ncbi:ectonucleotide pyrophosphatase/phosphodiesterase [Clostridium chauvoei]|uniref:alkaline phosphatase family protein n=1 Tax=Clostridium chauvoei TaxID=46867 RepID=UPI001C84FEB5|nr:ectonucleotide pyrophosphatase/phosphodiesterase [Clostridium chauvoei]MBX7366611.1 ectonucleotide pyrophosphatase/phosphodiesterase [Clostridium chauvoei]